LLTPNFPKKSLGQHFLKDKNICAKIVKALNLEPEDTVLEIGPGRGALTFLLEESPYRYFFALEKDWDLCLVLRQELPFLNLICADGLFFDWKRLNRFKKLKLVGNLPYNVASPLLWNIFGELFSYELAVFMVQKEVAERIVAKPGNKQYGLLSVWLQFFSKPKVLFSVPPGVFFPPPKVYSSVLVFYPRQVEISTGEKKSLQKCLKVVFQQRRKQLQKILYNYLGYKVEEELESLNLDPKVRPEALSGEDFFRLALKFF